MVEYEEYDKMKLKIYQSNCIIERSNQQLISMITYDEYTFSENDNIRRAWTRVRNTLFDLKLVDKAL